MGWRLSDSKLQLETARQISVEREVLQSIACQRSGRKLTQHPSGELGDYWRLGRKKGKVTLCELSNLYAPPTGCGHRLKAEIFQHEIEVTRRCLHGGGSLGDTGENHQIFDDGVE